MFIREIRKCNNTKIQYACNNEIYEILEVKYILQHFVNDTNLYLGRMFIKAAVW